MNVGSLLALLAYPVWIEPLLPLSLTSALWSGAFEVTVLIVLGCAALARRSTAEVDNPSDAAAVDERGESTRGAIALWLLLPAAAGWIQGPSR